MISIKSRAEIKRDMAPTNLPLQINIDYAFSHQLPSKPNKKSNTLIVIVNNTREGIVIFWGDKLGGQIRVPDEYNQALMG